MDIFGRVHARYRGGVGYQYYQQQTAPSLDLANLKHQIDQLVAKSQSDTFTAADLATLKSLVATVNDLSPEVDSLSSDTQDQLSDIVSSIATIEGKEGPVGPQGASGLTGETGATGAAGASGIASCPFGNCLSLQTTGSTVPETGSVEVDGDLIAGGTIQGTLLVGDGSSLTNLNASNISSGTLPVSSVPSSIPATNIALGTVSNTEFGHLDGVTSGIQTQLDAKAGGSGTTDKLAKWTASGSIGNSILTETSNGVNNTKGFGVQGAAVASGLWTASGWARGLELPQASVIRFAKAGGSYSLGLGYISDKLYFLSAPVDDSSSSVTVQGYFEPGVWTTSSWTKGFTAPTGGIVRWLAASGTSWGVGATTGKLAFVSSTADDASAAATYQGNWSTTGLRVGDFTTANAKLDVVGTALLTDTNSVLRISNSLGTQIGYGSRTLTVEGGAWAGVGNLVWTDSNSVLTISNTSGTSIMYGTSGFQSGGGSQQIIVGGTARVAVTATGMSVGMGSTGPTRTIEALDATNPQLRLTHTASSVYSELKTDSSGFLEVATTGGRLQLGTNALEFDQATVSPTPPTGTIGMWNSSNRLKLNSSGNNGIDLMSSSVVLLAVENTGGQQYVKEFGTSLPSRWRSPHTVATTNATVTTLATLSTQSNRIYRFEAMVTARCTGGAGGNAGNGASYKVSATFRNIAGTLTQIGSTSVAADEDVAVSGYDVTVATSGTDILIQIAGAATDNVTWDATVDKHTSQ